MPDVAIDSDSATINSVNLTEQGSDPATPASSHWRLYTKAGGLYLVDDTGAVTGPFGVGGGFANPMNAEGMMIVGGYDGIPTYLAPGLEGRVLTMGPVSPDWADPTGGAAAIYNSAWASPPDSPAAGELWAPSDGHSLYIREGAAWVPICAIVRGKTPPAAAGWTWVNQSTATLVDDAGQLLLTTPNTASYNIRLAMLALPTVPYTLTVCLEAIHVPGNTNNCMFGAFWRQDAAGAAQGYLHGATLIYNQGTTYFSAYSQKWVSVTASTAGYTFAAMPGLTPRRLWWRLSQDVTNRTIDVSFNGVDYEQLHQIAYNDFLTPDQIGIGASGGGQILKVRVLSWEVVES